MSGRTKVALGLGAVVGALALTGAPGAQAEPSATSAGGVYIVQTTGAPVAGYDGGVQGYRATRPAAGRGIDPAGADVKRYRAHLADGRKAVLAQVPGAEEVYDYDIAFNGFAARLTSTEAAKLAKTPGVTGIWKSELLQLDTLSTPDFLGLTGTGGVWNQQYGGSQRAGEGVIIGMLDSGFWPENPAFAALPEPRPDAAVIARKWKGSCDQGADTPQNNVTCNNKVIGARYFRASTTPIQNEFRSPRDYNGHGSHTASTAAGNIGVDVVINGANRGKMSGMAPAARLAIYKPCWGAGCDSPDVVAAIDQAVADGVDVLNYSVSDSQTSVVTPVQIGFMNAARAGVFVATSAGNDGPGASTVGKSAPWLTTVAAGSHDRAFRATATLGNGTVLTGAGLGDAVAEHDLVLSTNAGKADAPAGQAKLCYVDTLDPAKVTGKVVACARGENSRLDKSRAVARAGGAGMILYNTSTAADDIASDFHFVPSVHVKFADAAAVTSYAGTAGAKVALGKGEQYKGPAPSVGSFSSAGPALAGGGDLLKPDIMAPGVDVVAAVAPPNNGGANFASYQGTSMATPHIAGLGALLIGKHQDWDPTWVRSALMTTASQVDNEGRPIKRGTANATPFDMGAGQVLPKASFVPGLVYASTPANWTSYLCAIGQAQQIELDCGSVPAIDPSDLNYPSIAVGDLLGTQTISRRVTNVSGKSLSYRAEVVAPPGTSVTVTPSQIVVPAGGSVAFKVKITYSGAPFGAYTFGSLTWVDINNSANRTRSPIAVRPLPVRVPGEVSGTGAAGSVDVPLSTGYAGTLKAAAGGLVPSTVAELPLSDPGGTFPIANPVTSANAGKVAVTVPSGSQLVRFALFDADYTVGTDLDVYVFRKTATGLQYVKGSNGLTSNEVVTLTEPGEYEAFVHLYALPGGATSVTAKHHHWAVGAAKGNLAVSPASQAVTLGGSATVSAAWTGLQPGVRYLGAVSYTHNDVPYGTTIVSVTN